MNRNIIAYLLLPLSGIFLLFHYAAYQPVIGQGDHGRDLYVFAQTLQGDIPYQDYWWVYGPLMPYCYALFLKIFGIAIPSILAGKILLTVLSGTLIFFCLSRLIPPLFAFMAAFWFWTFQPDFYFTYNHIGGIACLMAMALNFLLYLTESRTKHLFFSLFFVFLLSLIKVNIGIANLFALILIYRIYDHFYKIPVTRGKKQLGYAASIFVPALIVLIYCALFYGMPLYEIKQCFPYMTGDQPYHSTPWNSLYAMGRAIILNPLMSLPNTIFALFTILMFILTVIKIISKKTPAAERKKILLAYALLTFLYFINLHEYILSGVLYRSYWATPFSTMLLFLTIGYGISSISSSLQKTLFAALFFIIFVEFINKINVIQHTKIPEQHITLDRGRITSGNQENWFSTVKDTTQFIQKNVANHESFMALPYDPIYYYLTAKRSPTRQLIFFEHINIPPEQEKKIIKEIEGNNTTWIVLSNRSISKEAGLGMLGKTYCPLIGEYINTNFTIVAQFGDWDRPAKWQANHAVRILKRNRPVEAKL